MTQLTESQVCIDQELTRITVAYWLADYAYSWEKQLLGKQCSFSDVTLGKTEDKK